jgi:hypothetical protein
MKPVPRLAPLTLWLAATTAVVSAAAAAPEQPPARPAAQTQPAAVGEAFDPSSIPLPDLAARLTALDPAKPLDYYLLAEEVAAEATLLPARDLARRLYVLAFELDRAQRGDEESPPATTAGKSVGPSVCIALAAMAGPESERRWLRALGLQLRSAPAEGKTDTPSSRTPEIRVVPDQVALELATALGLVRSGEGRRAATLLKRPGVAETLDAYSTVLEEGSAGNARQRIERWIEQWPTCPQCSNKRTIARVETPGQPPRTLLCPTCGGVPGPKLTPEERLGQLRLESALLRGIHRLWSAQVVADNAQPLRDPDPDELATTYRIDPRLSIFRDGRWVAPSSNAPNPPAATKPAPPPPPAPPTGTPPPSGS